MRLTEFLWKLLATAVVIGSVGVWVALHAQSDSALQGYAHLVVGTCTLVGLVSMIVAVILHIWQYKPRSRRGCLNQNSN
jgi:hypothetical protein